VRNYSLRSPHNADNRVVHAQQANWQEPLPLPIALMYRHPRIPVTASTLYAYATMRGKANPMYDPLHQALYPAANRTMFPNPLWIPPVPNGGTMEEYTEEYAFPHF
jgi:hypothetical protein